MKSAICLAGIVGGTDGKNGSGGVIPFEECYKTYEKHIIDVNNCDIFIHSWSCEVKDELIKLYKPKRYLFEPQKQFTEEIKPLTRRPAAAWRSMSRWYSVRQSSKLRKEYEKENNFKYDWVLFLRLDGIFEVDFDFSECESGHLHVGYWNTPMGMPGKPKTRADKINRSDKRDGLQDLWLLGDSKIADDFMDVYGC